MQMSKFLPTNGFKQIDPKECGLNKYARNSLKGCVLEVDLECPKELHKLRNYCFLAPDKIEIKRKMLSEYQQRLLICTIFLLVMLKNQYLTCLMKKGDSL